MLDAHGEDIDADDEGDEEVQVVAGAQRVDGQAHRGVVGVVGSLLGLWGGHRYTKPRNEKRQVERKRVGLDRWCKGPRMRNSAIFYFTITQ